MPSETNPENPENFTVELKKIQGGAVSISYLLKAMRVMVAAARSSVQTYKEVMRFAWLSTIT